MSTTARQYTRIYHGVIDDPRRLALSYRQQAVHLLMLRHAWYPTEKAKEWAKWGDGEVMIEVAELAVKLGTRADHIRQDIEVIIESGLACRRDGLLHVIYGANDEALDSQIGEASQNGDSYKVGDSQNGGASPPKKEEVHPKKEKSSQNGDSYKGENGSETPPRGNEAQVAIPLDSIRQSHTTTTHRRRGRGGWNDEEEDTELTNDEGPELWEGLTQHSLRQVASDPNGGSHATSGVDLTSNDRATATTTATTRDEETASSTLSLLATESLPSSLLRAAPEVPARAPGRANGCGGAPPTPAAPPVMTPLELATELLGHAKLNIADQAQYFVEQYGHERVIQSAIIATGDEAIGNSLAWFRQVVANPAGGMNTQRLAAAAQSLGREIDGTLLPRRNYRDRAVRIAHLRERGVRNLAWVLMSRGVSEAAFVKGIKDDLTSISSTAVLKHIYCLTSSYGDHPYREDCDGEDPIKDLTITFPLPDWAEVFKNELVDRAFGLLSPAVTPKSTAELVTKTADW